jgi:hypothetical protein
MINGYPTQSHRSNFSWISSSKAEKSPENWEQNDRWMNGWNEGKLIVPPHKASSGPPPKKNHRVNLFLLPKYALIITEKIPKSISSWNRCYKATSLCKAVLVFSSGHGSQGEFQAFPITVQQHCLRVRFLDRGLLQIYCRRPDPVLVL